MASFILYWDLILFKIYSCLGNGLSVSVSPGEYSPTNCVGFILPEPLADELVLGVACSLVGITVLLELALVGITVLLELVLLELLLKLSLLELAVF